MTESSATTRRILFVNADLCTGCRMCELACADAKEGLSGQGLSRIRVESWPEVNGFVPIVCVHCTHPPCVTVCPTLARSKDEESGRVLVDRSLCTGCGACIPACPFDAPRKHPLEGRILGCDLCDGAPLCVEVCTTGALAYVHPSRGVGRRMRAWAEGHYGGGS